MYYGNFPSPITSEIVCSDKVVIKEIYPIKNDLLFVISRSCQNGRTSLYSWKTKKDLLDPSYNIKTRVHEYGGKACCLQGQKLYFVNDQDQNIYELDLHSNNVIKLIDEKHLRFGDLASSSKRLFFVVEDHQSLAPKNYVAFYTFENKNITILHEGEDFYAYPRVSENGKLITWISWNHPHMPWDQTTLWKSSLDNPDQFDIIENQGSTFEPDFFGNELYYQNDKSGFWNLYYNKKALTHENVDFGYPLWILGIQRKCYVDRLIALIGTFEGIDHLYFYLLDQERLEHISLPFYTLSAITADDRYIYVVAASHQQSETVISIDPKTGTWKELYQSLPLPFSKEWISDPISIHFRKDENTSFYGFFYPPKNPRVVTKKGKAPLILQIHGGPTAHAMIKFNPNITFWTSRGYGFLDLNYRGSSGYGREFRELLSASWGIKDVEDAHFSLQYLEKHHHIDPDRTVIIGSSAGGYTTLRSLINSDAFKIGVSSYGVTDLTQLAQTTHKFEKHYLDSLVAPYPNPLYDELSPLSHADKISAGVLLLQGAQDPIVPEKQARLLYENLRSRGKNARLVVFPEEAHGFRSKKNIQQALEEIDTFVSSTFCRKKTHE